ncbi:MAG: hypothetical protein AB8D52_03645 [Gammaproteobacteria bacterium]
MKYHQLLIVSALYLLLQNYSWAETISMEPSPNNPDYWNPESIYYSNPDYSKSTPLKRPKKSKNKTLAVKYQQMVDGIETYGARLYVNINDDGIPSVRASTLLIPDNLSLEPTSTEQKIISIILDWVSKNYEEPYRGLISRSVLSPKLKLMKSNTVIVTDIKTVILVWNINLGSKTIRVNAHTREFLKSRNNIKTLL